ncbi:hypothetical protein M0R45_000051 [Rubus argutus]|uniref:Uncharacterized protein n=1 Tax=Rubus argutus TaxID=59490 RepID=A0AAW1VS71_RUBAR
MYLTEMMVGLVSPYVILVKNMLYEELPTHAPIKELKAKEVEAKKFAAVIVLEITDVLGICREERDGSIT